MARTIAFTLNHNAVEVGIEDHWTLLHLLREELGMIGTKEGCGSGECGACTVVVDGLAVNASLFVATEVDGCDVLTIEGLAAEDGTLDPIQQSFVDNAGIQCGFCSPGMIMSTKALLNDNPHPTLPEIQHALAGNICRCTGYVQIFDSVRAVSDAGSEEIKAVAWKDGE